MNQTIEIDVYGKAEDRICSGCEHSCDECSTATPPAAKRRTIDLVLDFKRLLADSDLGTKYSVTFFESTPENIARNPDVQKLLSMARLEPVVCIGGAVSYLGGFSPEGLLSELRKKQ